MVVVNSDSFSPSDLALFIESVEQISRIRSLKRQRKERLRAHYLADTLDQHNNESKTTLLSSDNSEEESIIKTTKEQRIHDNSTCIMEDQYYTVISANDFSKDQDDSMSCYSTIYSTPHSCLESSECDDCAYETLTHFNADYEEPDQKKKRNKSKRKLSFLGFVCKKYKKCFSSSSNINYCDKSDSWTQLNLV